MCEMASRSKFESDEAYAMALAKDRSRVRRRVKRDETWYTCENCSTAFQRNPKRNGNEGTKFCTRDCYLALKVKRAHPSKYLHGTHLQRARELGLPGESGITIKKLMSLWRGCCGVCGSAVERAMSDKRVKRGIDATIGHVHPLKHKDENGNYDSPGHVWSNVRLECRRCNTKKGSKLDSEMQRKP